MLRLCRILSGLEEIWHSVCLLNEQTHEHARPMLLSSSKRSMGDRRCRMCASLQGVSSLDQVKVGKGRVSSFCFPDQGKMGKRQNSHRVQNGTYDQQRMGTNMLSWLLSYTTRKSRAELFLMVCYFYSSFSSVMQQIFLHHVPHL